MGAPSFSQTQIIWQDSFDDNSKEWPIATEESHVAEIKDGGYQFIHKTDNGNMVYLPSMLDPQIDFEIEATFTLTGGADDYGFGFFLKDSKITNNEVNSYFIISGNGYYKIYSESTKDGGKEYEKWTTCSSVNKGFSLSNILKIKQVGSKTLFSINGQEVYKLSGNSFWGSALGFVLYNKVEMKVDDLKVKQDRGKINTIQSLTPLVKENLGPSVNSVHREIMPVISADGKTLYMDVKDDERNTIDHKKDDVWYATLDNDGKWSKRMNSGTPINNAEHNFVISVTPDNNSLVLHDLYNARGEWDGDGFSISHREKNGWSIPEKMVVADFYNLSNNCSFCLSPDRKVLLMSIERKEGNGQHDLFVSFQKKNNEWSAPKPMGNILNTFGNEVTPFISADGKTLYFSTDGKLGYGNNDIFVSRRLDESWTKWTEPINLGPHVNSADWDAYYTVPASGEFAYLVSSSHTLGQEDIFRIKIAEEAKPGPVVIIHGKVLDKVTKQPLSATIDYHELSTGKNAGSARSNPVDGSYKIILPYGMAYGFLAEKGNFLAESDNIDLTTIKEYTEIERDLYLSPIEIGKSITLNNVFFVRSKAELLPGSFSELDRLVKVLTDNTTLKIEISGHTDNVGDAALNAKLSEDRVVTIKNYLISKNISAKRLSGKGYGGAKPIASNATEETRKLNRRVEFIIIGK